MKIRVGVIFGGRSGEHEVSLLSARAVITALDRSNYEVVPLGITKEGRWVLATESLALMRAGELPNLMLEGGGEETHGIVLNPDPTLDRSIDVVFPVLHGTYGEDGTIQGLLELANIPYVGAGVVGSAVSMDKGMMRVLFAAEGLPLAPWVTITSNRWQREREQVIAEIAETIGYPCFVKPANLGSSVGVSKAKNCEELVRAMAIASDYDRRIVIEQAVTNPREIECSVLGNDDPIASVPGEIKPGNEFYDYEAKYLNDNSQLVIPASLADHQVECIKRYAVKAFQAVDCAGMARVDFFIDTEGKILVNEINTIPGFTQISMYPKLWEASGIPFHQLVERLIELAITRNQIRNQLKTTL